MPKVIRLVPMSYGNVLAHYEDGSSSVIPFGSATTVSVGECWPPEPPKIEAVVEPIVKAPKRKRWAR